MKTSLTIDEQVCDFILSNHSVLLLIAAFALLINIQQVLIPILFRILELALMLRVFDFR